MAPRVFAWRRTVLANLLIGTILMLTAMLGMVGWHWYTTREEERAAALHALTQTAQAIAVGVDDQFTDGAVLGLALAADRDVQSLEPSRFQPSLRSRLGLTWGVHDLAVIDLRGTVLGRVASGDVTSETVRDHEFYARVRDTEQPTTFWEGDPLANASIGPGVAVPIRDDQGALVGVLALTYDMERFRNRLARINLQAGQSLTLIDPEGRVATLVQEPGRPGADVVWNQGDGSRRSEVSAALRGETVTSAALVSAGDRRVHLAALAPASRHGWVVAATWSDEDVLATSWTQTLRDLLLPASMLALVLARVSTAYRLIAVPLRRLATHLERLGGEEFEPITTISTVTEIARVTEAFNSVGDQLQKTLRDLRDERAHLVHVLDSLPIGVIEVSAADSGFTHLNASARQLWADGGEQPGQYDPTTPAPLMHPDGRALLATERPLRRALRDGETVRGEVIVLRRPGQRELTFSVSVTPIRDDVGRIVSAIQTIEDVTERRQAEATLQEHQELLRELVLQFPAALIVIDRTYRLLMVGGERHVYPNSTTEAQIGDSIATVLPGEEFDHFQAVAERVFDGHAEAFERNLNGRTVRATVTPLRSESGVVDRLLVAAVDVTEETLREARSGRDEKLRALGQMASGIAHDLNQSLTLVAGYSELVAHELDCNGSVPHAVCDMVQIIERSAYDGGETVKRLLTFARGRDEDEHLQTVDLGPMLDEVRRLTAPHWRDAVRTEGRRIVVDVDAPSDLSIYGSHAGLREALTNLVFNAVDAMPGGGTITLAARREDAEVCIDVADTGTGMSEDVQARMFEPFFTTKGAAGTGLGLPMVFGIVQRLGGNIDVTSAEGRGTTFHLRFPIVTANVQADESASAERPAPGLRILVVDDEPNLAKLLAGMLQSDGHSVLSAHAAETALTLHGERDFDLVISDLSMGDGMNGWDLAAAIAVSPRPVPVLLATGWGAGIDPDDARARGVSGVISKPYRRTALRAAIRQVIGQS